MPLVFWVAVTMPLVAVELLGGVKSTVPPTLRLMLPMLRSMVPNAPGATMIDKAPPD